MRSFRVTVQMPGQVHRFYAIARSASSVYEAAAANQGDAVFGITVLPL